VNYTVDADAVDSDLHAAVRVGRRLHGVQGTRGRPQHELRISLRALRVRRQSELQRPLLPLDERRPLGIPAGSALFIVWQQGRESFVPQGEFQFNRDFGQAIGAPATNVFLVKFSKWLDL
jgi:hypothetical protein